MVLPSTSCESRVRPQGVWEKTLLILTRPYPPPRPYPSLFPHLTWLGCNTWEGPCSQLVPIPRPWGDRAGEGERGVREQWGAGHRDGERQVGWGYHLA